MVSLELPEEPDWVAGDKSIQEYGKACWNAAIEAAAAKMADTLGSSFSANQIRKLKK